MTSILLNLDFLPAVLSGRKRSTIRRSKRAYTLGPAILSIGQREIPVEITDIRYCRVVDLTEEDALRDGFNTIDELLAALRRFYSDLRPEETVTIASFSLIGDRRDIY